MKRFILYRPIVVPADSELYFNEEWLI